MSSAGQIDPVMALAGQQQAAAMPQAMDPVAALAMGHSAPAATPPPPEQHGSSWADPAGALSAGVRNFTNALSFNLADPVAAAVGAITPALNGYASTLPTYGERYNQLLKWSREDTSAGQKAHPYISLGASIAGGIANPAARALPTPSTLTGALLQGGGLGAGYGAGGAVGNSKDIGDALKQTGVGAATGVAAGGVSYGIGKLLSGATRSPDAQLLHDEGVPLTIGQNAGGTARTLEDASTHIPMLGNAIKGRQGDALIGFNRAGYNRALEPLGVQYASDGPVGNEGIAKIGDLIGQAYTKAFDGATVKAGDTLTRGIEDAQSQAINNLEPSRAKIISNNIDRLITQKMNNGELSGDALQTAKNWFSENSRAGANASLDDRATAKAYGHVFDALKAGVAESDPEKGALLQAADTAWSRFVPLSGAAASNAASAKGGVFTASQLGQALRGADTSVRHGAFAKGLVPMQDLAQAGQRVLPSTVPDSGTPLRGLIDAAPWILAAAAHDPMEAGAAATGLAAATGVYSKPGQHVANALIYGAPAARKAMGAVPKALLPGIVAALRGANSDGKQ